MTCSHPSVINSAPQGSSLLYSMTLKPTVGVVFRSKTPDQFKVRLRQLVREKALFRQCTMNSRMQHYTTAHNADD